MFVLEEVYRRRALHEMYGGQKQGGISTPSQHDFIMLFTGETGKQYGYKDGWSEDRLFLYTGEGQRGDMTFKRGNLAIREHVSNGNTIHLFENVSKGSVRYVGEMVCTGFRERRGPDIEGNDRRIIVFELTPIDSFSKTAILGAEEEQMWHEPLNTLRERAIASSIPQRRPAERTILSRYRSDAIRAYVIRRANGVCEACNKNAPFKTDSGRLYLEPHHIRRLSDGGPDDPRWVVALCPNCHGQAHYGEDRAEFNRRLEGIVNKKEK